MASEPQNVRPRTAHSLIAAPTSLAKAAESGVGARGGAAAPGEAQVVKGNFMQRAWRQRPERQQQTAVPSARTQATQPVVASTMDHRRITRHVRAFGGLVADAREAAAWSVAEAAADLTRDALGFETVAVNRYRPVWDDYRVDVVLGSQAARHALLGTTAPQAGWTQGVLIPSTAIGPDVHFCIGRTRAWEHGGPEWLAEDAPRPHHQDAWDPLDTLLLQLRGRRQEPLAVLSFDGPHSGLRPGTTEAKLLDLARVHMSLALQVADSVDRVATWRGQLQAVEPSCVRLKTARSADEVARELCACMTSSMGWQRAVFYARSPGGTFVVEQTAGSWPRDAQLAVSRPLSEERATALVQDASAMEGGCLTSTLQLRTPQSAREESALLAGVPRTVRVGLWRDEVLLVPMRSSAGALTGILALEHPTDGLLPRPWLRQHIGRVVQEAQRALERVACHQDAPGIWLA